MMTRIRLTAFISILGLCLLAFSSLPAEPCGNTARRPVLFRPGILDEKTLDINRIICFFSNDGHVGERHATGGDGLFFNTGQDSIPLIYSGGLWVVGKIDGDVRSAVCNYGTEFQPGAIRADGTAGDTSSAEYRMYKYDRGDAVDASAVTQGCPSEVIGDQMVFCVFNDMTDHKQLFTKQPIGLEVQMTAWAFDRPGALGNTVYIRYRLVNKGGKNLREAYAALWFDADLGAANDDFTGCDPSLGVAYGYNGGAVDSRFGSRVPAIGCDVLQGPIVDSPGETATLPGGVHIEGKKVLGMTAYFVFLCGSPLPGMSDPTSQDSKGAQEAYWFVSGLNGEGNPWLDPTDGYKPTPFPFSGDPFTGTGWLINQVKPPCDVKMGSSTGPFDLGAGESQDVIFGLVVGAGKSNLSSLGWMKFNDQFAQYAYDQNFNLPSLPPAPVVSAAQTDGGASLSWDDAAVSYNEKGYVFEGFNVWQAAAPDGPWTRITTIDMVDQITQIWDDAFVESMDAVLSMPLQFGKDTGLRYDFTIQKDYITNGPLVNGRQYYFAVTAYAYNPDGVPKVLETATNAVSVIPQKQVLDVKYQSTIGDTLPVVRLEGPANDGRIIPIVVDPAKLNGHTYGVSLKMDEEREGLLWTLKDETTNQDKLVDQSNVSGDENYLVVDGVKWVVVSPEAGRFNYNKGPYAANGVGYAGFEPVGSRYLTGVNAGGTSFFYGGFIGADFHGSTLTPYDYFDIRIDFWNRAHNTEDPVRYPWSKTSVQSRPGYAFKGKGVFPGAAYDVTDPANPRRLNICCVEQVDNPGTPLFWDPIEADQGDGLGGREYLFIMASNYVEDPSTLYNDDNSGRSADVDIAIWACQRGTHTSDEEWQAFFYVNHPMNPANVYEINTADYSPRKSADIARDRLKEINVFPNPYFGGSTSEVDDVAQFVTFNNLPETCTIRIFSLSGQWVRTIEHENGTPFERWDLLNSDRQPVGWGMFLVHIRTAFGDKTLKLAVVNREQYP